MYGYLLTFFTQQDKRHQHLLLSEWLLAEARRLGIGGATVTMAAESFGHHGKLHSAHFFELADQPVEVSMAVSAADAERLFERLAAEQLNLFYVKTPVEFGMTADRTKP